MAPAPQLTDRQREVLAALVRCDSRKAAAHELGITPRMFRRHLEDAQRALGAQTTAQAIAKAIRRRLM